MVLAIDSGTTGCTCIVFDERAEPVGRAYGELGQHFPQPGWVEHDAGEIWELTRAVAGAALADAGVRAGELAAVGITNQRETVCVWDPSTGLPLCRAIVWQDRRTAERCARLREEGFEELVRARTGLVLDPYFSATKIEWLLEHVEGLRERALAGRAVFGTVDSWLLFKLTGLHLTDASNASRTMLYDIAAGRWDPELLELFGVPERSLPEVRPSAGAFGVDAARGARRACGAGVGRRRRPAGRALRAGLRRGGDGQEHLRHRLVRFAQRRVRRAPPAPGLLSTVAWGVGAPSADAPSGMRPSGSLTYALEASIFVTGAAVQWLRDGLGIIADAAESEALAASLPSNEQVYFVPALTGLGSPHWDPHARGTIVGLTRGSTRAHLARAALEAIGYQTVDAVRAMEAGAGVELRELRADGGATANRWLMQFQADILGVPVLVPEVPETTTLGAALLAGVGGGLWTLSDVRDGWRVGAEYEPVMSEGERACLLAGWHGALSGHAARSEGPGRVARPPKARRRSSGSSGACGEVTA